MATRTRMLAEALLAVTAAIMTIVSLAWPRWFEMLLGQAPDHGDGSLERLFALAWLAVAAMFTLRTRRHRLHRLRDSAPADPRIGPTDS